MSWGPIALFSLLDTRRQWFKSKVGLDVAETAREYAFCDHTVLQECPMVVNDATVDPRFSDNPLVTGEPGIRFYAGVPIRTQAGTAIGTLCVIGQRPREVGDAELAALVDLAELLEAEIHLRERLSTTRQLLNGDKSIADSSIDDMLLLYRELSNHMESTTRDLEKTAKKLHAVTADQERTGLELWAREAELRSVIENAGDAYISTTADGVITTWNRQATIVFGWTAQEALGQSLTSFLVLSGEIDGPDRDTAFRRLSRLGGARLEAPALTKARGSITVEMRSTVLTLGGQTVVSIFLHDISDRKHTEQQQEHDAEHDWLTGLPNRRSLAKVLPDARARAAEQGRSVGLLFIDLDGFKLVNDEHGHDIGDRVLKILPQRASTVLRSGSHLFRLGGDEFMVVLQGVADVRSEAWAIADRLIKVIREEITLGNRVLRLGASIGIAVAGPEDERTSDELMQAADEQMYMAKKRGSGSIVPKKIH
jgi:diguanylate cyclase (GGDEF)-like protein/PAS domain S-box-containing protein